MTSEEDKAKGEVIEGYLATMNILTDQVKKGTITPVGGMIKAAEIGLLYLQKIRGQ